MPENFDLALMSIYFLRTCLDPPPDVPHLWPDNPLGVMVCALHREVIHIGIICLKYRLKENKGQKCNMGLIMNCLSGAPMPKLLMERYVFS
jgi:hypothetical protein